MRAIQAAVDSTASSAWEDSHTAGDTNEDVKMGVERKPRLVIWFWISHGGSMDLEVVRRLSREKGRIRGIRLVWWAGEKKNFVRYVLTFFPYAYALNSNDTKPEISPVVWLGQFIYGARVPRMPSIWVGECRALEL